VARLLTITSPCAASQAGCGSAANVSSGLIVTATSACVKWSTSTEWM
jgi:hypothetical protein